jgi:HAD superfamily hydrolase (TIGR01509 family)
MGTLVYDPFFAIVPAYFGMTLDTLLREKHPTAWIEFELGRVDEATFLPQFFRDQRAYDHAGLKEAMRKGYAWLDGIEPLLAELRTAGVPMHALSNYATWYRMIEQRLGLGRYVAWSFVSCETGFRKPDPQAYLHAATVLGVDVAQCLFVDDRESNCAGARAVGMGAIRFEGVDALRRSLVERGIMAMGGRGASAD